MGSTAAARTTTTTTTDEKSANAGGAAGGQRSKDRKTAKGGGDLSGLRDHLRTMRFGQTASKFFEIADKNKADTAAAAIARAAATSETVSGAAKQLLGGLGGSDGEADAERYEDLSASAMALFTAAQVAAIDAYFAVELIAVAAKKSGAKLPGKGSSGAPATP